MASGGRRCPAARLGGFKCSLEVCTHVKHHRLDRSPAAAWPWSAGRAFGHPGHILALLALIIVVGLALFGPGIPARAAQNCSCDKTGAYVDPNIAEPVVEKAKDGATSPNKVYTVKAQVSGTNVSITVTNIKNQPNTVVLTEQVSGDVHWYFSPDDDRFVLDILANQQETV